MFFLKLFLMSFLMSFDVVSDVVSDVVCDVVLYLRDVLFIFTIVHFSSKYCWSDVVF